MLYEVITGLRARLHVRVKPEYAGAMCPEAIGIALARCEVILGDAGAVAVVVQLDTVPVDARVACDGRAVGGQVVGQCDDDLVADVDDA